MSDLLGDANAVQETADRLRVLRQELADGELKAVLELTPAQPERFDDWPRAKLAAPAERFDVDTTTSQKPVSWGMRSASTLGGLAICAIVLLFLRSWGFLDTWIQAAIVILPPLMLLAGAEFTARRHPADLACVTWMRWHSSARNCLPLLCHFMKPGWHLSARQGTVCGRTYTR